MCRGRKEGEEEKIEQHNIANVFSCELCKSEASVYCQADDAFLCRKCDKLVHGANFLAQRHIRCIICGVCKRLTHRYLIGVSSQVILPTVVSFTQRSISKLSSDDNSDEDNCSRTVKEPFLFL
ncbi:B-box domain protein 30-like [Lycium barbarum]|uniref:B-box domain protein 30-like n=1 Tax=Lycium barbarum TaxID=112863 RepID=UPI00293E8CDE|nr:B-box domain protein 30-like [Lycium barbarum]